jgi:type I restriction enzyme S subunit
VALLATIKAEKQKLIANRKPKVETRLIASLPPINPDDMPFTLPDGWVWVRTSDICESIVDCPHSTPTYLDGGMDCIDTTCFDESGILLKTRKVDEKTFHERNNRLIPKYGDIVYSREGIIGQAVIVPQNGSYCLGQRVMLFRPNKILLSTLFRLLVNSPYFRKKMVENHKGIGAKHINMSDLRAGLIPLP